MHHHDRLGARADAVLDVIRVDAQRLWIDVGEVDLPPRVRAGRALAQYVMLGQMISSP